MIKTNNVSKKTNQTLVWASLPLPQKRLPSLLFSMPNTVDGGGDEKLVEEVGIFICGGNSV
jgi:hypothetical protein